MSTENLTPVVYEQFKGTQTLPDAQDVEIGYAIDSKNVEYHLGSSVQSRSGRSRFLSFDGGPHILSMAEYALLDGITRRLIILNSDGRLWKENGDLTTTLIESGMGATVRLSQQTAFGRQYMAFSNGKQGTAPPRYYNDTEMFPVSQGGPGVAPNATDGAVGGNVDAGTRFVRIVFERKDGYRTAPSPAQKVVSSGGRLLHVSRIPRGPANIARRIIIVSAAVSADVADTIRPDGVRYFFIPNTEMVINDNTTVTVDVDFSDAALTAAEEVTDLQFLIVLPEQAAVTMFNDRLIWSGGQNSLYRIADEGPLNLDFNGGFEFPVGVNGRVPNGWQGVHPGCDVVDGVPGASGAVFRIVADGVSQRGTIENTVKGLDLNKFIRPNTAYGGRLRLSRSPGLTQGTVSLYFLTAASSQLGQAVGVLTIDASQLSTDWREFSGPVFPATPVLPTDLVLRISGGKGGDGQTTVLGPAGEWINVDFSAFFELNKPYTPSRLYVSDPGLPGNYRDDQVISVSENDGQQVRVCYPIRGNLYIWKEQSLHVVSDNGDSPQNWPVQIVSPSVGTPSIDGVSGGEGWTVSAARSGLYFFDGGFPQKISQEVQPTWDEINWELGHLLVVLVDVEQKRIFIQAPMIVPPAAAEADMDSL